jgi:hypothetical protein
MNSKEAGKSVLVAAVLLTLGVHAGRAQPGQAQPAPAEKPSQSAGETLIIGTTTLRLAMSKESLIPALAIQYDVTTTTEFPGWYRLRVGKSAYVGDVYFNDQGSLVAAVKRWTPEPRHYSDGEIGRALIALIASLVSEGKRACSMDTLGTFSVEPKDPHSAVPRVVDRIAMIKCGHKDITIEVGTQPDGTDGMYITESIHK